MKETMKKTIAQIQADKEKLEQITTLQDYINDNILLTLDAQKIAELICEYNELVTLVEDMRKAQRIYSEMFPTGYECYAPIELENKVDNLINLIRGRE